MKKFQNTGDHCHARFNTSCMYIVDGSGCVCSNNTKSSDPEDFKSQCNTCARDYEGIPTDNHQCYRFSFIICVKTVYFSAVDFVEISKF